MIIFFIGEGCWRVNGQNHINSDLSWKNRLKDILVFTRTSCLPSRDLAIHRQVKINDKTEQRFGVVMTPLSSSK